MENKVINKRDLTIAYTIDLKSVSELSKQYGITFSETKNAIRACGLTVRKNEEKLEEVKTYTISIDDNGVQTPLVAKSLKGAIA